MNPRARTDRLMLAVLLLWTLGASASAYVDPGTGSLFTQILIAGTLGGLFTLKRFWGNVWRTVTRRRVREDVPPASHDGE